jgi:hypothetical protein
MRHHPIIGIIFFIAVVLLVTPVFATPESCSLSVASIPQGGDLLIDTNGYGSTPVTDMPLGCGLHTIRIEKNGYSSYVSSISLDEGIHQNIVVNLRRLPDRGQVTILSDPPGGDLYIDGNSRGLTPLTVDNLLPGRHEILIKKSGYEDFRDVVSVNIETINEYTEYLVPLPGTGFLLVTSAPNGADVHVDGSEFGKTPTNLQRVGAGNHSVEISRDGYWNFSGVVNVRGGEALSVTADLAIIPTSSTLYLDSSPQGMGIYLNNTFKGFTPQTLGTLPSGDYELEFRHQNGSLVNQSFRFTPGATEEIFATFENGTGASITNREWQYENESSEEKQPGWTKVNTTPVIEKTYTWITNGHEATITIDIPQDLYDYYKEQPHPRNVSSGTFSSYAISERDRSYLHNLVEKLKDASGFKSYSARNDYQNVVAFVQGITYQPDIDPVTKGETDYWKYPIETLADGNGDCEDTAILTAALLKEMGHDVAIVILPEHAAVAVACTNCNGYYYPIDGRRYYYLETTGTGFSLGTLDQKYRNARASLVVL